MKYHLTEHTRQSESMYIQWDKTSSWIEPHYMQNKKVAL